MTARSDEEDQGTLKLVQQHQRLHGNDYATAVRKAQDRDQWRSMVSKVPDGYGTRDSLTDVTHLDSDWCIEL